MSIVTMPTKTARSPRPRHCPSNHPMCRPVARSAPPPGHPPIRLPVLRRALSPCPTRQLHPRYRAVDFCVNAQHGVASVRQRQSPLHDGDPPVVEARRGPAKSPKPPRGHAQRTPRTGFSPPGHKASVPPATGESPGAAATSRGRWQMQACRRVSPAEVHGVVVRCAGGRGALARFPDHVAATILGESCLCRGLHSSPAIP